MAICGFVGIFGEGKLKKRAYRSLLKARHRGGDFRFKTFEKGILGANPLLLEGEGGLLKANEDRTIFAVLDGEIFNREELKKELTKKRPSFGHQIKFVGDPGSSIRAIRTRDARKD